MLDALGHIKTTDVRIARLALFDRVMSDPAWNALNLIPGALHSKKLKSLRALDTQPKDLSGRFEIRGGRITVPEITLHFPQVRFASLRLAAHQPPCHAESRKFRCHDCVTSKNGMFKSCDGNR